MWSHWHNPLMLTGLVVLAIPVAIHLVMRTRPRRMMFPALRFVRESRSGSSGMLRLKHLLLLVLRMAALGLFVLVLARPVSRRHVVAGPGALGSVPAAAVLCFDNSPSMGYRYQGYTHLEAAKRLAADVVKKMSPRSRFAVVDLTTAGRVRSLDADRDTVLAAVERVQLCHLSSPVSGMLRTAENLLGEAIREDRREIYLFTDMTETAWRGLAEGEFRRLEGVPVYVVDVGADEDLNVALNGPQLSSQRVSRGATVEIGAAVVAGERPVARTVAMEVDGEVRGRQPVELKEPRSEQTVTFAETPTTEGILQGRLALMEDDALPADNVRYFTVQVGRPPRVAVVRTAARPADLADDARVISMALAPAPMQLRGQAPVEPVLIAAPALETQPLEGYEAVFLADAAGISAKGWAALERFVADGGGLVVLMGQDVADDLERGNSTYASAAAATLLGCRLGPVRTCAKEPARFVAPSYDDPALIAFEGGRDTSVADLAAPAIRRYVRLEPAAGARSVLTFTTGDAALVAGGGAAAGRVFTLATGPRRAWSNLASGGDRELIVLLHSLLGAIRGDAGRSQGPILGQEVTFGFPRECAGRRAALTGPGLLAPQQRQISTTTSAAIFPPLYQPGNYRLRVAMPGGTRLLGFSLNLDEAESRLQRRSPDSLPRFFAPGMVHVARDLEDLQRAETLVRRGREITAWLVPILLAALALELLLANRFYRRTAVAASRP